MRWGGDRVGEDGPHLVPLLLRLALFFALCLSPATAQVDLDAWFKSLENPVTSQNCCSTADGEFVEWEFRGRDYWVRLVVPQWNVDEWTPVPSGSVLRVPNLHGRAIVWWYRDCNNPGRKCVLKIRCFLPGAGL